MKFPFEIIRSLNELKDLLSVGMKKLAFLDNFESFETSVIISATSEIEIKNLLQFIPSKYIIVSQTGNGLVTKSTTEWTRDNIYLYNNGSVEVTATIIFMR